MPNFSEIFVYFIQKVENRVEMDEWLDVADVFVLFT